MQAEDVQRIYANIDELREDVGFQPATPIEEGVEKFIDWYKLFYKITS